MSHRGSEMPHGTGGSARLALQVDVTSNAMSQMTLSNSATAHDMTVREITTDDQDRVVDINQTALEGVGPIDREGLALLVKQADPALVLDDEGDIAGFVITLPTGATYDSSRYEWFEKRLDD